jgi:hypothetical protein
MIGNKYTSGQTAENKVIPVNNPMLNVAAVGDNIKIEKPKNNITDIMNTALPVSSKVFLIDCFNIMTF